jgi:transcriptional regulator with XRE-family HTH domain
VNNASQQLVEKLSLIVESRRKQLGLSQEGLAGVAEIDRTYVSQIARAKANPSLEVLCKLAMALNLTVAQILGEVEIPPQN